VSGRPSVTRTPARARAPSVIARPPVIRAPARARNRRRVS